MAKKVDSQKSVVGSKKAAKKRPTAKRTPTIEAQAHYQKVGRLRKPIADAINRKAADIYISDNHLKHIFNKHRAELELVGLTPKIFVDLVVSGFNRIYKGVENSLWLVIYNGSSQVVVIDMNYALKKGFYEVKTATVVNKNNLKSKELLWIKK